ncbi:hypothetical protein NDQ41_04400 [Alcaligenes faecalis]|uniref:hypothetical protein n=1 Tax=Alcaligenes TaxID=507 RepID=UPI00204194AB|nr:hypothetical protein [Alcaligenes faecalis]MCM2557936.1 hypothetical protein [Alcaligenes faecalis]MCM2620873.1 hypothetical protein [Alcaligenes faecalis]MDK7587755.1 hypothetical protein [Alcaligenes phenolicus]
MDSQTWAHQASRRIERSAKVVMDYMADLDALGRWSLGCFDTETVEPGLVVGTSLFDGGQTHVSVEMLAEQGLIRYWVGSATQRTPRISAMVQPLDQNSCILIMLATRGADMDENRWLRLQRCHETELDLIQAQLHSAA